MPTLTDKAAARLRKLEVGQRLTIPCDGVVPHAKVRALYRGADRARIRVSIKTFANCIIVERRP